MHNTQTRAVKLYPNLKNVLGEAVPFVTTYVPNYWCQNCSEVCEDASSLVSCASTQANKSKVVIVRSACQIFVAPQTFRTLSGSQSIFGRRIQSVHG